MIAVVLNAPDYKARFSEARSLLGYGFALCRKYEDTQPPELTELEVARGKKETVALKYGEYCSAIRTDGQEFTDIEKQLELPESLEAPVSEGEEAGFLVYYQDGEELGRIAVLTAEGVEKAGYRDYLIRLWKQFLLL